MTSKKIDIALQNGAVPQASISDSVSQSVDNSAIKPKQTAPMLIASLLMVAYLFSFLDRQILILMIEPIQRDLQLSDTMFSLLHGTAFALFYAIMGLFMGRLVDSYSRTNIITFSIILWSATTALCGVAKNFTQLFIARMFVGVGEAGLSPATYSLVSDLFTPAKRAKAFAVYSMGIYFGTGIAFIVGGKLTAWLETIPPVDVPFFGLLYSWQITFFLIGLPGILLAIIIKLVIREPSRGVLDSSKNVNKPKASSSFADFRRHYLKNWQAYGGHNLGYALHMMYSYSLLAWLPAFYLRHHNWTISEIGMSIGPLFIICGSLGCITGSAFSEYLVKRGISDAQLRISAIGFVCLMIAGITAVSLENAQLSLIAVGIAIFFIGFPSGLSAASLQTITPANFRGQAGAVFLLICNVLGLGIGPIMVALITEQFFGDKMMIGSSLLVTSLILMPLATILLWRARNRFNVSAAA